MAGDSEYILGQIKYADPTALMALGMQYPMALADSKDASGRFYLGGIVFKVNGAKAGPAHVKVKLSSQDLYDIEVINRQGKVIATRDEVFCDQLMEVIDHLIERDPKGGA